MTSFTHTKTEILDAIINEYEDELADLKSDLDLANKQAQVLMSSDTYDELLIREIERRGNLYRARIMILERYIETLRDAKGGLV